jgi:hypothetical protein
MRTIKGILSNTATNENLHLGKRFNSYRSKREKWNSYRRFAA